MGILRFTVDHPGASRLVERGSSPGVHLAISVDQLVALLFAKYAGEVVKTEIRRRQFIVAAGSPLRLAGNLS
jgi:hypothetical protein